MQADPMSVQELMLLILGITAVIVIFTSSMFLLFRKFLNNERAVGEKFRSENRRQP